MQRKEVGNPSNLETFLHLVVVGHCLLTNYFVNSCLQVVLGRDEDGRTFRTQNTSEKFQKPQFAISILIKSLFFFLTCSSSAIKLSTFVLLLLCPIVFASSKDFQNTPLVSNQDIKSYSNADHSKSELSKQSFVDRNSPKKMDSNPQTSAEQQEKVCIIGSGNWGSAISTLVGKNCERLDFYYSKVNMWVFEETVELEDGSQDKLTNVINTQHENVKYLPGVRLPENIVAIADLAESCRDATLLIFVLPHQFLPKLLPIIRESVHPNCRGVSLIKGLGKIIMLLVCVAGVIASVPTPPWCRVPRTCRYTRSSGLCFACIFGHRNLSPLWARIAHDVIGSRLT